MEYFMAEHVTEPIKHVWDCVYPNTVPPAHIDTLDAADPDFWGEFLDETKRVLLRYEHTTTVHMIEQSKERGYGGSKGINHI